MLCFFLAGRMTHKRILFISYSHKDKVWLDRILAAFTERAQGTPFAADVWTDRDIEIGDDWREKIDTALKQAYAGFLIVTPNFQASHFIVKIEVPELVKAVDPPRKLRLTWVHAERFDYQDRTYTRGQPIVDAETALADIRDQDEQQRRINEIADRLIQLLAGKEKQGPDGGEDRRGDGVSGGKVGTRRRAGVACGIIALLLLLMGAVPLISGSPRPNRDELLSLLHERVWIGYEPADYDPRESGNVSDVQIRRELVAIREAGFTGIVTYGSRKDLARIPHLAKDQGFAVIMGIWNPLDLSEIRHAYEQQEFVNAYCMGHNGLDVHYNEGQLERKMRWLRRKTGKPITTTQLTRRYSSSTARLNLMGDFLFPDVHHDLKGAVPEDDLQVTMSRVTKMEELARRFDRPLMLKMVLYPTRPTADARDDPDRQTEYLTAIIAALRDPLRDEFRQPAYALHGAFDAPWKQGGHFLSWDPYTGLFDRSGEPRPAVAQWVWLNTSNK